MDKIEELQKNYNDIRQYLIENGQISFLSNVEDYYKKILILSCASLFENQICKTIYDSARSKCPIEFSEFIRNKAIERQYHTYFNWKATNSSGINTFIALWGDEFKKLFNQKINADEKLKKGAYDFLILGNERNLLAHENFIEYNPIKTFDDVFSLYRNAKYFVDNLLLEILGFKEN